VTTTFEVRRDSLHQPPNLPPVDWPLLLRIRFFAGTGLLCAAVAVGVQLLFADIPNGVAFSKYSPTLTTPLWPSVWFVAIWISASGLAIAILLPVYRWRYGGHVIGVIVVILAIPAALISPNHEPPSAAPAPPWQMIVALLAFAAIGASTADSMRSYALGHPASDDRLNSRDDG
jgi:hypothetical protein